jgi:hypothetical protein
MRRPCSLLFLRNVLGIERREEHECTIPVADRHRVELHGEALLAVLAFPRIAERDPTTTVVRIGSTNDEGWLAYLTWRYLRSRAFSNAVHDQHLSPAFEVRVAGAKCVIKTQSRDIPCTVSLFSPPIHTPIRTSE